MSPLICPQLGLIQSGAARLAESKQLLQKPALNQSASIPGVRGRQPYAPVNGGPSTGLGAKSWSDYRPYPPNKTSQGENNPGKVPCSVLLLHLWQMLIQLTTSPMGPNTGPLTPQEPNVAPKRE